MISQNLLTVANLKRVSFDMAPLSHSRPSQLLFKSRSIAKEKKLKIKLTNLACYSWCVRICYCTIFLVHCQRKAPEGVKPRRRLLKMECKYYLFSACCPLKDHTYFLKVCLSIYDLLVNTRH